MRVGVGELLVILLIILLLFGAARLPELARSLGKAIREFKNALKENPEEKGKDSSGEEKPQK
jgi:sec-independent protein translocase protein TatA